MFNLFTEDLCYLCIATLPMTQKSFKGYKVIDRTVVINPDKMTDIPHKWCLLYNENILKQLGS